MSSIQMVKSRDLADHSNTRHFGPSFSVRFPDHHSNTKPFENQKQIYHFNTIIQMVTVFRPLLNTKFTFYLRSWSACFGLRLFLIDEFQKVFIMRFRPTMLFKILQKKQDMFETGFKNCGLDPFDF